MSRPPIRAIMVAVDYADLLAQTLPYNRHHFEEVMVVTSLDDWECAQIAHKNDCVVHATDTFYHHGAAFNKWAALEEGLNHFGREGWLCIMDADVAWPKKLPDDWELKPGCLYSPNRRMYPLIDAIPQESLWQGYRIHRNIAEWAGYSQIFHASDPVLGPAPWHEVNWMHAGGADSFFQSKWAAANKIRPSFEVLHLGPSGENWCGRSTAYATGSRNPSADARLEQLKSFIRGRVGKEGVERFAHEKILKVRGGDPTEPRAN